MIASATVLTKDQSRLYCSSMPIATLGVPMGLSSEKEARRLVDSVLPEPDIRQKCLKVFADAIAEANVHGRDKWAVTHTTDKVRLIVGRIIVCTLRNRPDHGPIWMALDKALLRSSDKQPPLEQSGYWEWDNEAYPEYPLIQSRNGYYLLSVGHAEAWPMVRRLHFESIYRAANQTTMNPGTPKGHSSEILKYLRNELGRHVPDPLF